MKKKSDSYLGVSGVVYKTFWLKKKKMGVKLRFFYSASTALGSILKDFVYGYHCSDFSRKYQNGVQFFKILRSLIISALLVCNFKLFYVLGMIISFKNVAIAKLCSISGGRNAKTWDILPSLQPFMFSV